MAVDSLADAPKDLLNEHIKHLEKAFTIDTTKLKEITHHFVDELNKGQLHQRPTDVSDRQIVTRHRTER